MIKMLIIEIESRQLFNTLYCFCSPHLLPQRLQAEVMTGHQLLQSLLCDAVSLMETPTGQKR